MSRREYDRYDDQQNDYYRRGGRTERDYEDVEYRSSRYNGPGPSRRNETAVKERESDTVVSQGRRTERGPRQPDFLREDYGRNPNAGPLVVRDDREEEYVSRGGRSHGPAHTERVERDEVVYRERSRGPPYPRSDRGSFSEQDELVFRDRIRPRPGEKIDIRIKEKDTDRGPPPQRVYRDDEEVVYRQNGRRDFEEDVINIREERSRSRAPPPRTRTVDKEGITIRERSRGPPPRRDIESEKIEIDIKEKERDGHRGRDVRKEEIDIDIREKEREGYRGRDVQKQEINIDIKDRDRSVPPPGLTRSASRGALVRKDREEWVVRKRRTPSPSPPRDVEKEEIVIRRTKERTPSPEPILEPPPPEPAVFRPPIIQEVITHHRHIDHGYERAPEPPLSPPTPPPAKEEEDIDINIRRTGTRNGKPFDENINIDIDIKERSRTRNQEVIRREVSSTDLRREVSRGGRRYVEEEDTVSAEADYYNRRVSSRGYPGEAYNGATRSWGVADIPPGTERVAMDGIGGGRQEITWNRYSGERHGKFLAGDRVYDSGYGNGSLARDDLRESRVTETRIEKETTRGSTRDRRWTEISKDLVIEEAIKECGYDYDENDRFFYVMEYLRYEDVLRLVEVTEDIRRERHERIQEIKWESEQRERKLLPPAMPPVPLPPRRGDANYYYESDVVYERDVNGRKYRR